MSLPNWLYRHMQDLDVVHVGEAIERAEKKTSGEIVALVVGKSTTFGHVRIVLFTVLSLFFVLLGDEISFSNRWHPAFISLGSIVLASALAHALSTFDFIRRLVTSDTDMAASVFRRAQLEFHETGIPATEGKTGVLIMISMSERRAVILGDKAISEKIPESVWVETIGRMLAKLRADEFRDGLIGAIDEMGEILAKEFPIQANDRNELSNQLLIKE
jgi:putative membrane protein